MDDRPVIVSGSSDRMVRVWDLGTGERALGPLTGHDGGVNAVAVSMRHGRAVMVSGSDQTVRVWDLKSELQATLRIDLPHRVLPVASAADRLVIGTTTEVLGVDLL